MDSTHERSPYFLWFKMAKASHAWERLSDFFPGLSMPLEILGIGWKPARGIPIDELKDMLYPDDERRQGAVAHVYVGGRERFRTPLYQVPSAFAMNGEVSTCCRMPLGRGLLVRPEDEVKLEISGVNDRIDKFRDSILFLLLRRIEGAL